MNPSLLNRLNGETDPDSATVSYARDARDAVVSYTDPRSIVTSFVPNGFGEVIQETSPDTGTTIYERDARRLVTRVTDARSAVSELSYDVAVRVVSKTFPAAPSR